MSPIIKTLLLPLSLLYGLGTWLRNKAFDKGILAQQTFTFPVICVGNLSVGGTGKTPMIAYLLSLLQDQQGQPPGQPQIAVLSRGYGRKTKGFRLAQANSTALDIGDEPLELYRRFGQHNTIAVCEDRVTGLSQIQKQSPAQVVLLDDGLQHRYARPSLSLLLCDYHRPFYRDTLLPAGRLREPRSAAKRADVIVITKCPPHLSAAQQQQCCQQVRQYSKAAIFFATTQYEKPRNQQDQEVAWAPRYVVLAGLAHNQPFIAQVKTQAEVVATFSFPDHHRLSKKQWQTVCATARAKEACIMTTAKDLARLQHHKDLKQQSLHYLPISTQLLGDARAFDQMLLDHCRVTLNPTAA